MSKVGYRQFFVFFISIVAWAVAAQDVTASAKESPQADMYTVHD